MQEFVNDDGDFDGFRIDGGIADIPIMGGAYVMGVKGFFAWHDDRSDLQCSNTPAVGGTRCLAVPIIDDDPLRQNRVAGIFGITQQFTTERDINHWRVALELAQGPMGLKKPGLPSVASTKKSPSLGAESIPVLLVPVPLNRLTART